jgi:hypothetical protein
MIHTGPFVKFAFAERDAARFRDDVAVLVESPGPAPADLWAAERLVTDACRRFDLLGLIDDELRRASRVGSLASDDYAKADAEVAALFTDWLAASRNLEAILRRLPPEGSPVAGEGRFSENVREASWMLGDADRVLDDPRMIALRDAAVDASRRGDVGPVFENVRP